MLEGILRSFWTQGLNTVSGVCPINLIEIINQKKHYVVYDDVREHEFKIAITDYDVFLKGFAKDINRFGCASLESINDIYYKAQFKHSHAWKCIKCYYAAYYAAHSFLRLMGISCTNFEQVNLSCVENIADIYSKRNGVNIQKGYYKCQLVYSRKELICTKITTNGNKGSHEQLWEVYLNELNFIINEIKLKSTNSDIQQTIIKLADLRSNLIYLGSNGGNWLSKVRNEINYKHLNGLWYPYKSAEKYFDNIEVVVKKWIDAPESFDLTLYVDKPILKYLNTCVFLVALNIALAKEMSVRCPKGLSFQHNGILNLLHKINI